MKQYETISIMKESRSEISNTHKQTIASSLVLPIFGSNEAIFPTLLSIHNQLVPFEEIVIVDDNPGYSSREYFIKELFGCEQIVKYIKNATNLGSAASLNLGVEASTREIIVLCNDDDLFESSRNLVILNNFRSAVRPEFWGFTSVECIGEHGSIISSSKIPKMISDAIAKQNQDESFLRILKNQNIIISSGNLFFSREIWSKAGKFNSELTHVHDWEMAIKLAVLTDPIFIKDEIYSYRLHGGNSFKKIELEVTNIEVDKLRKTCEDFFWQSGNLDKLADYFPEFTEIVQIPSKASSRLLNLGIHELRILYFFKMLSALLGKHRLLFTFSKFLFKKIESFLVFLASK